MDSNATPSASSNGYSGQNIRGLETGSDRVFGGVNFFDVNADGMRGGGEANITIEGAATPLAVECKLMTALGTKSTLNVQTDETGRFTCPFSDVVSDDYIGIRAVSQPVAKVLGREITRSWKYIVPAEDCGQSPYVSVLLKMLTQFTSLEDFCSNRKTFNYPASISDGSSTCSATNTAACYDALIAMGAAPTEIKTDRYDFLTYHPTTLFLPLQVGRTDEKGFALRFDFGSSLGFAEQVKTIVRSGTGTWVKEYSPHSNYVPWPGEHGGSGGGVVELCPYVYTSLCGDSYSWLSKKESYSSVINETTIISHIDTTKGILMGRICNDVNTNGNCEDTETFTGLNDASGDAIPDVSITNGTNTWSAYAREEFGTWAIGNLPAGTYTITYPSQIVSSGRTYYLKTPPLTVTLFPVCSSTGMPSNLCAVSWSGYNDAAYGPSSDCRKIQVVYFQDYNANGERDATFWTDENGNSYTGVLEPAIAGMKVSVTDISDVLHPLSMGIFETGSDGSFYVDQGIYQGNTYRITPIDIPVTQNVRYQFTTGDPLLPNNPIDHMVGP